MALRRLLSDKGFSFSEELDLGLLDKQVSARVQAPATLLCRGGAVLTHWLHAHMHIITAHATQFRRPFALAETLPPEKQEALMRTYRAERDPRMRYNMLLEFSSYLRQGAAYGGNGGLAAPPKTSDDFRDGWDDDVGDGVSLKWEIARVLLIVGLVLGAVMGVAWWLGQMVDAQDVDEALG